jgi:L-amino acid N-acyltransferase YncA
MAVRIRFAQPTDAAGILAIYGPYCESTCVSFEIVAPTIVQIQERIARITTDYPWLVADVDGQIAGYVYASRHHERAAYRWSVDVAVYVTAAQHRRGVGQILYETLFSILREQGYFKVFAGITLPNPASIGLHESLGFRPAALFRGVGYKFGRWLDVGWWQFDLQPERAEPTDPQPIHILHNSPAVTSALADGERKLAAKT